MFENKLTHNGIHYSRYIASWKRAGGKIYRGGLFERWLREKEQLNDEEISNILLLAENGKLELQGSAKAFIEANKSEHHEERKLTFMGGHFDECQGTHIRRIQEKAKKAISDVLK